jgi:Raf kinase inhibitor-like YbhB/YbcL family protein
MLSRKGIKMQLRILWYVLVLSVIGFGQNKNSADSLQRGETEMNIKLISSAFAEGEMIPRQYTCDGANISPPLSWDSIPDSTKSFALICDDPDAPGGTWVHWVIYNIPANIKELAEKIPLQENLTNGAGQGKNDSRKIGYSGPCPPGGTHRYYFKLYALDVVLVLNPGATKNDLLRAMEGHILDTGQLMGKYSR